MQLINQSIPCCHFALENFMINPKGRPINALQFTTSSTNDLLNLIPIGTLTFYDLPTDFLSLYGLQVDSDPSNRGNESWKWLDLEFLSFSFHEMEKELHPIAEDIRFLLRNRFLMATYKVVSPATLPAVNAICIVRIYSVPSDIEGARFLNEFRYSLPRSLFVEKSARNAWCRLICYLDFSEESWRSSQAWIDTELLNQIALIPVENRGEEYASYKSNAPNQEEFNFHLHRWAEHQRYERFYLGRTKSSLSTGYNLAHSLSKLYNSIPSPDLSKYKDKKLSKTHKKETLADPVDTIISLLSVVRGSPLKGMKTILYPFQLNSLCKMFEKESITERKLVPNFVELRSALGDPFFLDLTQGTFWSHPELFTLPRGGILAENMGLGKTMICLSLICLTKNDMSVIPEDRVLYTKEVENKIRQQDEIDKMLIDSNKIIDFTMSTGPGVESLIHLCKRKINQNSLPWKYFASDLPDSVIQILVDNPGSFKVPLEKNLTEEDIRRRNRLRSRSSLIGQEIEDVTFKTLYLCNTTLIFVPENLFHQWNNELKKHVQDDYLKKLFVSNQFKLPIYKEYSTYTNEIPQDIISLIRFDLIIISHSLIAKQQLDDENSSDILKKIYWKRLIIDEGHSTSSRYSKTSILCKEIESERRWAVTGTPTSGLTRLYMDEEEDQKNAIFKKNKKYSVKTTINERDDLAKLGAIIGSFLNVEPYKTNPKLWAKMISKPLAENRFGSHTSLSKLLSSIVVRHSLFDVEKDLQLPKLHHIPVFLEPSYHNKLAINLFTAVLAVNAVSSERTDIDYMFHPANRQQLRRLIMNLQRATFHWSGFKQEDVETLISICNNSLKKHSENNFSLYTQEDVDLLESSRSAAKLALSNPRWRTIALLHEMNYYVQGIPEVFIKSFGTGIMDDLSTNSIIGIFGAPHINSIQEFFYKNRFMDMVDGEKLSSKLDDASKPFWKSYWGETAKRNMERFNKQDANQEFKVSNDQVERAVSMPELTFDTSPKKITKNHSLQQNKKKRRLSSESQDMVQEIEKAESIKIEEEKGRALENKVETSFKSIRNARILGTGSAKLSYISSRLLEHQRSNVKSIVFFEFEDSAYYLTESLDVLGVNYILYATFISTSQRAANLAEFSNYSEAGITLIMDLRLASHGLNIIAATRVYFLSPVWQRSVEAQAIKRAHRIGQTKEVFVETLVLEGTLEEEIYRKRTADLHERDPEEMTPTPGGVSTTAQSSKPTRKFVIDDTGMQQFILKHKFLPQGEEGEAEYSSFKSESVSELADIQLEAPMESSLLDHTESVDKDGLGVWDIHLFTNSNLAKLNNAKNQKIRKTFSERDYVRRFIDPEEQLDNEPEVRTPVEKQPARKKVRF